MSTFMMADEHERNVDDVKLVKESSESTGKKRKLSKEEKKSLKEKKAKVSVRRKPGFDKELYNETSYFVKNGLRYVIPYYFTFTSHCKGRWVGRKILDVFKEEFRSEPPEYYEKAITSGKITVNGQLASFETILKDNVVICHKVHRHEPPVTADAIQIVESNQDVVVINKPSSIPVHPCGRYRHNSIVFLLGKEHGLTNLFTVHRIDRLTSGILMFARTLKKAQELEEQVRERQIEKEYICRVKGDFPSGHVECNEPILVVSHKVGVCRVSPHGKPCKTMFTKLHHDGDSSIVKCKPFTGRMHQIRVHLQWLGYPIIDDPIYNSPVWGDNRGKGGVTDDEALQVIKSLAESSATIIDTETTGAVNATTSPLVTNSCNRSSNNSTQSTEKDQDYTQTSAIKDQGCTQTLPIKDQGCTLTLPIKDQSHTHTLPIKDQGHTNTLPIKDQGHTQTLPIKDQGCTMTLPIKDQSHTETSPITDQACRQISPVKDEHCSECKLKRRDPTPAELTMCLHALSYKGPDWEYKTEMPSWAVQACNEK